MSKGGSIRKLRNGKYQWVGYYKDEDGKIHRPTRSFNTLKEALERQEQENEKALTVKKLKNNEDYTVNEYFELWKKAYWHDESRYSVSTVAKWKSLFNLHILPYIGNDKIDNINFDKLNDHLNSSNLSKKSKGNVRQGIQSMLACAFEDKLIYEVNTDEVSTQSKKKKNYKVYNVLSESNYRAIIKYMTQHKMYYTNAIIVLYECGLRIEELAFTEKDIKIQRGSVPSADFGKVEINRAIKRTPGLDGEKSTLFVSEYLKSSHAHRVVPLTSVAIRAIENQIEYKKKHNIKSEYVFCSSKGTLMDQRNVLRSFHSAIEGANREEGLDIPKRGLHSLRKLFCKRMVDEVKMDWELLRYVMGHGTSEITKKHYYSVAESDVLQIAKNINLNTPSIHQSMIAEANADEIPEY